MRGPILLVLPALLTFLVATARAEPTPEPSLSPSPAQTPSPSPLPFIGPLPSPTPSPAPVASTEGVDAIRVPIEGKQGIERLTWEPGPLSVRAEAPAGSAPVVKALLRGSYARVDWSLLCEKEIIVRNAKGSFEAEVPLTGPVTRVSFVAVDPAGETQIEEFEVRYSRYPEMVEYVKKNGPPRPYVIGASLGTTIIHYEQTLVGKISEHALTLKASYVRKLKASDWELGVSSFATVIILGTSQPATSPRFLGINLRAGYRLRRVPAPWRISLQSGIYYATILSGPGYRNLAGPQLYPTVSRALRNGDSLSGYLKFSPVTDGFELQPFGTRELAIGFSYGHPIDLGRSVIGAMDLSNLRIERGGREVNVTTFSLSVGFTY